MLDLPAFLRLHPWSDNDVQNAEPLQWLWHYQLAARPEAIWPYLVDTSRLNRVVGYEPSTFEERDGVLHGFYTLGGQQVEWDEPAWDWNYARCMGNVRVYANGMITVLRTIAHLVPDQANALTHVYIYLGAVPRKPAWRELISAYFAPRQAGYGAALRQIERAAQSQAQPNAVYRPVPVTFDAAAQEQMQVIRTTLLEWRQSPELVDRLWHYIETADEFDLYRIQVVPLARAWHISLSALLALSLHAVRAGLFTLSWDLICPHCRGVRNTLSSLMQIPTQGRCDVCQIDFDPSGERSLEVIFHLHPAIKELPRRYFCLGDAFQKSHIKVQQRLAPGSERSLPTSLEPGHYRMRIIGETSELALEVRAAAPAALTWNVTDLPATRYAKPCPTIQFVNSHTTERVFIIEDVGWQANALSPQTVFNLQEFRDLFSQEAIATHLYLDIGVQTIVFSDIISSTKLYAYEGDAKAFYEIKQHFETIRAVAQRHHGAVIKTIGDGVMVAFSTPQDGWQAALELQRFFINQSDDIDLRLAIHSGRCLAVTFNTGIDYFGHTVNVAAKLLLLVGSRQIAVSKEVFEAVNDQIEQPDVSFTHAVLQHPNLPDDVLAYVINVADRKSMPHQRIRYAPLIG